MGVQTGTVGTRGDLSCRRPEWPSNMSLEEGKISSLRSDSPNCVSV